MQSKVQLFWKVRNRRIFYIKFVKLTRNRQIAALQIIFNPKYDENFDFDNIITKDFPNPYVEVTLTQEGDSILMEIEWVSVLS